MEIVKVTFYSDDEILTANQVKIYVALQDFLNHHHYSPTMKEIANMLDIKNAGTVQKGLKILKRKGYINYKYNKRRSLEIIKKLKCKVK